MIRTVFFLAIVAFIPDGCTHSDIPVEDVCVGDVCSPHEDTDRTVPEYEGQTWHERYVKEACGRCAECCVAITENGFIDPYGVERPWNWLPLAEPETQDAR